MLDEKVLWIMPGYTGCRLTFWRLLQLQQTVLLGKVEHNEQTKDFPEQYIKYRTIQLDYVKEYYIFISKHCIWLKKKLFDKVRGKYHIVIF